MTESLPWVVTWFYLTAGYLLVAGCASASVTLVAHSRDNRLIYGGLAVVAIAGAGFQLATAFYYQAADLHAAARALEWQVDFASVVSLGVLLFFAFDGERLLLGKRMLFLLPCVLLVLVVGNRASPYSARFADIHFLLHFEWEPLRSLSYIRGQPSLISYFWYLSVFALWTLCAAYAWRVWRRLNRVRARVSLAFLICYGLAIAYSAMIDAGAIAGLYFQGFVLSFFVICMSVAMAIDAARRSQRLALRERQMQGEILQRRRAEDKMQRLSQVFMQAPTPIHIVDLKGQTLQVNDESVRCMKSEMSDVTQVNFLSVMEQLGEDRQALIRSLAQGVTREYGPYFFPAGQPVDALYMVQDTWLKFGFSPIFNAQQQLEEFVVRLEDVSANQFAENAIRTISLAVSAETGHAFFKQIVVYLARLLQKKYVFIGLKASRDGEPFINTLAAAHDGQLGENFAFPLRGTPSEMALQEGSYAVACDVQDAFPGQGMLQRLNAQSYLGAAIKDEHKQPIGVLVVLDVKAMEHIEQLQEIVNIFVSRAGTELQRLNAEKTIRKLAYQDHLTGLANRIELNEYLVELLKTSTRRSPSAFIQIDLDHFKTINDALGHDVGDDVLRCLGRRLHKAISPNMMAARIGGDEFAVVVHGLNENIEADIASIAIPIMRLMEQPVQVGEHLLDVGCTMGVVLIPEFASTAVDTFRCADIALYQAKNCGRGSYQLFTPAMREAVNERMQIEKGLRSALQNQEFSLYFQPQVDALGSLVGAEALLRWTHPERGMISPDIFIRVAEESGLINPIGQWVLQQALLRRKHWSQKQVPFFGHLSVNVSPWQFARPDFVDLTLELVEQVGVPPGLITLEITESAVLSDVKETIAKLATLRRAGFTIALDDFGTGYSSLAYLRDLPLDRLKIDKTFVDALETTAREPLVESMIAIGNSMGLQVVAEGVETQLQLDRLKDLGCNIFQGYFFARPLPETDLLQWLDHQQERFPHAG